MPLVAICQPCHEAVEFSSPGSKTTPRTANKFLKKLRRKRLKQKDRDQAKLPERHHGRRAPGRKHSDKAVSEVLA